jgi:nucleoside-diphosphate-sugar epimerase
MRILITGGAGFIGTRLAERLRESGDHDVYVFDRERLSSDRYVRGDVCDWESLDNAFRKSQPELTFHLAAMVSRKESEETPSLAIQTNATGTQTVCAMALRYGSRVIYGGSSEEYGTAFSNGAVTEETPFGVPTGIYSMTKRMAEEVVQYFATFKGLTATTVRFFMLYGSGERPSKYRSALVRFSEAALSGEPLLAHMNTERSWAYVDDAVDALCLIMDRKQEEGYETFNLGRDEPMSAEDLAKLVVEKCGSSSQIKRVVAEPTVIPIKRASFEKAKSILGWEAQTTLENGLGRVIDFLKSSR